MLQIRGLQIWPGMGYRAETGCVKRWVSREVAGLDRDFPACDLGVHEEPGEQPTLQMPPPRVRIAELGQCALSFIPLALAS